MDLSTLVDIVLHIDRYIDWLIAEVGLWSYLILFLVIFCETGFVVTPFLPGDSLLFAVGTFAARGSFSLPLLFVVLSAAAIAGDSINYTIGKYFGEKLSRARRVPFFKKEYLDRTHRFYERYGRKTIVIARFVPIVRTLAPFVAGIGTMPYAAFLTYNVAGGVFWVALLASAGYFFGTIPIVEDNFSLVIFAIIFISILPAIISAWIEWRRARAEGPRAERPAAPALPAGEGALPDPVAEVDDQPDRQPDEEPLPRSPRE